MSSFGEKKEKTFEEKVKERLGEFIRVNNPKYLDDVHSAKLAIESELRQEQEMLQRYGVLAEYPSRERVFGNINNGVRQEIFINKYPANNNVKCVHIRIVTRKNNKERDLERY